MAYKIKHSVREWHEDYQGGVRAYHRADDGSVYRAHSDRALRKMLKLSPRQFRKLRRRALTKGA